MTKIKHPFRLQISGTMKCMHNKFSFIVLNVRDGTETKYPSIVFLSIQLLSKNFIDSDFCHNYLHTLYLFACLL